MPRRARDGEAARAGAADSITAPLDLTPILALLGGTLENDRVERKTKALDLAYFAQHPEAKSYVRPYHAGELPLGALLASKGRAPSHVAVALVSPGGERVRAFIWPNHIHASARLLVERRAAAKRAKGGRV